MRSQRRFRIEPRPNGGLEDLHRRADHVEDEDHPRLLPCLQAEGQHGHLDCHGRKEEEVVAGEPGTLRVEEMGADQQGEQERTEQARPALLDAEADELVERVRGGAALGPIPDPRLGLDEARQRCPDAGGAVRAGNRRVETSPNAAQSTLHASLDALDPSPHSWRGRVRADACSGAYCRPSPRPSPHCEVRGEGEDGAREAVSGWPKAGPAGVSASGRVGRKVSAIAGNRRRPRRALNSQTGSA